MLSHQAHLKLTKAIITVSLPVCIAVAFLLLFLIAATAMMMG